jgi:hypothetical protein
MAVAIKQLLIYARYCVNFYEGRMKIGWWLSCQYALLPTKNAQFEVTTQM